MPVFCCSFVPCSSGTPWGEGKGQAAVKVEQVLQFPALGCSTVHPHLPVSWGVSAVSLLRTVGFSGAAWSRKEAEVCCHCRAPWKSQRSPCWVAARAALPVCAHPRAGKALPWEGQSAQVWDTPGSLWLCCCQVRAGPEPPQGRVLLHGSFLLLRAAATENAHFLFLSGGSDT